MKNILDVLFLKHSVWIKYVKSFGCPDDVAEDYVQEMYIKIFDYSQKTNNDLMFNEDEVNYYFIYVTLKNLYYDAIRRSNKRVIVEIDENIYLIENDYTEDLYNVQSKAVEIWLEKINSEIDALSNLEYSKKLVTLTYYKYIFDKALVQQVNLSVLSRDIGITYWSLRNTLKNIKRQINDEQI
jgi:RNA polymerase sigma factor (sigma-70 family)